MITPETNETRKMNAKAFEASEVKHPRGTWVAFADGKLAKTGTTRAEAVGGLAPGYYCTQIGRVVPRDSGTVRFCSDE